MKVLLSIKPEFVEKIFSGEKIFEFRKAVYRDKSVKTVMVYATRPVGKIVGEFDVAGVVTGSPSDLWDRTRDGAGISEDFFYEYFSGRDRAFAFEIASVTKYDVPLSPGVDFVPPQSYMYVEDDGRRIGERREQLRLL